MNRQSGFTLIELMIVVAIIAIIAAIAIPNLLSARLNANETAAIATLRNISSAQAQFQAGARADTDGDGVGEFGGFRELTGAWDVRNDADVGPLRPPVLSGAFREVVAGGNGAVGRSGYYFLVLLPMADGAGISVDEDPARFTDVDADLAETTWCCYAWPVNYGHSGNRTFCVNQSGDVVATDDADYSGVLPAAFNAANAFQTGAADSITAHFAVGTTGYDGNPWVQVN